MTIIQDLKNEVKNLKEDKENANSNKQRDRNNKKNNWKLKHCWTHGCNHSHHGVHCNNPFPNYCKKATFDNQIGGSQFGMDLCLKQNQSNK